MPSRLAKAHFKRQAALKIITQVTNPLCPWFSWFWCSDSKYLTFKSTSDSCKTLAFVCLVVCSLVFCWFWLSLLPLPCTSHYLIENFLFWLLPEGFSCPCSNAHPLPAFVSLHLAWECILKGKEAMCPAAGGQSFCRRSWISAVGAMKDGGP